MENEKRLIRRIVRHRSREAADELIRAHYDEIYRFMYRQTLDREDALDLTQDCFLAMLRGLSYYDETKSSFRTWLFRIAANKVIDRKRTSHMILLPLEEECLGKAEDVSLSVMDKILVEKIEERVACLEPEIQKIYRMHFYGEMTFKEIGEALDRPENTIKTKYYRLISRLRKEFGNDL